jgi:uncharacterized protein (TIGR00369 family)
MEIKNPHYRQVIEAGFKGAAFVNDIGIKLLDCGPGWCESSVKILPRHLQHGGVVHAGIQSSIADHTAGAAATTLLTQGQFVVTAEFKVNLLRSAVGDTLFCRAQVLKSGKTLVFVEAEVFAVSDTIRTLVSKMTATMSIVMAGHAL